MRLDAALTQLRSATGVLADLAMAELPDEVVKSTLVELDTCRNRLDAACAHAVGVFDAKAMWAGDGARSAAGWVASHTEAPRGVAGREIVLARSLRAMPATDEAFRAGTLGSAKAGLLAAASKGAPAAFPDAEPELVRLALTLRVDQARQMLDVWSAHVDPSGADDESTRRHEARAVFLSQTLEGMWRLDGLLPGELGEILSTELDRRTKRLYAAERALAEESGIPVSTTAAQRRADALVELAMQARTDADGGSLNVPAITAIIDVERLTHPETRGCDPVGESEHGQPVTAVTARRYLCDAAVSRVVLGADSTPVDLGRTARLPSPAQRRALAVRDRGCTFPGCDRPPGWTSAHHLVHWIDDGPTDLQNLLTLCTFHHHRVHEGGFGVTRGADGWPVFTRPGGTALTVPKSRLGP